MLHTHQTNCEINNKTQENNPVCVKKREQKLNFHRQKQPFRVAVGKSKWVNYETFNPAYNLREILKDEIVIEFDTDSRDIAYEGINFTAINLYRAGYTFSIWEHGGRSPHLHIHNLPITHLSKGKLREFKKFFIRKFVPEKYLDYVDFSLCGIHLIAIEWSNHWKGCYGIKRLLNEFNPQEQNE